MSLTHLPKGAKARFGKGIIYQIQFSPDSTVLPLQVASVFGYIILKRIKRQYYSWSIRMLWQVLRLVPMEQCLQTE